MKTLVKHDLEVTWAGEELPLQLTSWLASAGAPVLERARAVVAGRLAVLGSSFGAPGEHPSRRPWSCDALPRVISAEEWSVLEAGLIQRVEALEAFLDDVYGDGAIIRDGIVPSWAVATSQGFMPALHGARPRGGVWIQIAGIDLLRDANGFTVVEDNLRVPSGAAYVMANRLATAFALPDLITRMRPIPVLDYPARLAETLRGCAGDPAARIVVLTPGRLNAAYFEHAYLAAAIGAELVEGTDLIADGKSVRLRDGDPVDVVYRRVDDAFLDPVCLRPDSLVGVPGLLGAWRAGQVVLANAPGGGVGDDKGLFPFVPEMIRYYTGRPALLAQPRTLLPWRPDDMAEIRARFGELIMKPAWGAGGYGIIVGSELTLEGRVSALARIEAEPRAWIAQEHVDFSRGLIVLPGGRTELRRMDLRPYVLSSPGGRWVLPGGLTRVSPDDGLIVNSSRGGASKDTWICAGVSA